MVDRWPHPIPLVFHLFVPRDDSAKVRVVSVRFVYPSSLIQGLIHQLSKSLRFADRIQASARNTRLKLEFVRDPGVSHIACVLLGFWINDVYF